MTVQGILCSFQQLLGDKPVEPGNHNGYSQALTLKVPFQLFNQGYALPL